MCFKFCPVINAFQKLSANKSFIMVCLQNYGEKMSLTTFCQFDLNWEELSYLY